MAFSVMVELLNLRLRARSTHPVTLHDSCVAEPVPARVAVEAPRKAGKPKTKGKKR
jgi:hypothetical protein